MRKDKVIKWLVVGLVCFSFVFSLTGAFAAEKIPGGRKVKIFVTNYGFPGEIPEGKTIEDFLWKGTFWDKVNFWSGGMISQVFMMRNPDIYIETTSAPWASWYGEKLLTALAGGTAPAVYWAPPQDFGREGLFLDITDYVKNWEKFSYVPETLWEPAIYNGRYYGIPTWQVTFPSAIYRINWFKEAGIFNKEGKPAPPDNWTVDDWIAIATKLTNPKKQRWGFGLSTSTFRQWCGIFGAPPHLVRPDPTGKYTWRAAFNVPEAVRVLEFYKEALWDKKVAVGCGTEEPARWGFWKTPRLGLATMTFAYTMNRCWDGTNHRSGAELPGEPIGVTLLPRGPEGTEYSPMDTVYAGINPTLSKEQQDAAWKWMTYYYAGTGTEIFYMRGLLVGKYITSCYLLSKMYHLDIPVILAKKVMHPDYLKMADQGLAMKRPFEPSHFGLSVLNTARVDKELEAAVTAVLGSATADPKKELDKVADVVNKVALNYKVEGATKKNIQEYYTALAKFYKENYPDYYNKVFSGMMEKYFKIW